MSTYAVPTVGALQLYDRPGHFGDLRGVFSINWNGADNAYTIINPINIPVLSLGGRNFGSVQAILIDNFHCRSPLHIYSVDMGWDYLVAPQSTEVVNVELGGGQISILPYGGVMKTDLTNITLYNYDVPPYKSNLINLFPAHINANTGNLGGCYFTQVANTNASAVTLFSGLDVLIEYLDVVLTGTLAGAASATCTLEFVDGLGSTNFKAQIIIPAASQIVYQPILHFQPPKGAELRCSQGLTATVAISGTTPTTAGQWVLNAKGS